MALNLIVFKERKSISYVGPFVFSLIFNYSE